MLWKYDDGGRAAAGFRGHAGDCVTRAIAIALERDYREVYDTLAVMIAEWRRTSRSKAAKTWKHNTPRDGVPRSVIRTYFDEAGAPWTPTMSVGRGVTVHLRDGELPDGRLVANCSGHLCAVIDGVVYDTADPTRDGTRAVYGYWTAP